MKMDKRPRFARPAVREPREKNGPRGEANEQCECDHAGSITAARKVISPGLVIYVPFFVMAARARRWGNDKKGAVYDNAGTAFRLQKASIEKEVGAVVKYECDYAAFAGKAG